MNAGVLQPFKHFYVFANSTFVQLLLPLVCFCLQITTMVKARRSVLLQGDFCESVCSCHFTKYLQAVLTAEAFWRSGSFFFLIFPGTGRGF